MKRCTFGYNTNTILKIGDYKMSNTLCLEIVMKELKMPSSLTASLNNVLVTAEAFQISVKCFKSSITLSFKFNYVTSIIYHKPIVPDLIL